MSLRFYIRISIKKVGLDDYLMLITGILFILVLVISTLEIMNGGARHIYYLNPVQLEIILKYFTINQPFAIMSSAFGKASVAILILRIIGPNTFWRKWFLYINLGLYMLISALCSIFAFVRCSPVRALWEVQLLATAKCWSNTAWIGVSIFQSSYGAFMDFALALLPITIVWNLKLDMKRKIGLCLLLGTGIFTGICAAIKTTLLEDFASQTDLTWATYGAFAWASLEIALVMICGSVPTLKPLYDYFAHNKPLGPHKRPQASSGKSSYRKHTDNSSDGSRTRRFFGGSTGNSTLVTSSVGDNHPWQASRSDLATASKKINVEQRFDIDLEENISSRGLGDNAGRLV